MNATISLDSLLTPLLSLSKTNKKWVLQEVWVRHTADVGAGPVPARTPDRAFVRRSPSAHIGPYGPSGWHGACPYTGGITHTNSCRTKKWIADHLYEDIGQEKATTEKLMTKKELLADLKEAMHEVRGIQAGKNKAKTMEKLLTEL